MGFFATQSLSSMATSGPRTSPPKTHTPWDQVQLPGYRYYNPTLGRWVNRDRLAERGGLHLFGFVRNDPIRRVDRFGLIPLEPIDPDPGVFQGRKCEKPGAIAWGREQRSVFSQTCYRDFHESSVDIKNSYGVIAVLWALYTGSPDILGPGLGDIFDIENYTIFQDLSYEKVKYKARFTYQYECRCCAFGRNIWVRTGHGRKIYQVNRVKEQLYTATSKGVAVVAFGHEIVDHFAFGEKIVNDAVAAHRAAKETLPCPDFGVPTPFERPVRGCGAR